MLLKTSFPYTGGFLCCPNKMVRFKKRPRGFALWKDYMKKKIEIHTSALLGSFFIADL